MPVRKLSVALEESVADDAAAAAARRGLSLSAWLNGAAERALRVEAGLVSVREWETEHGALTPAELGWADEILNPADGQAAS